MYTVLKSDVTPLNELCCLVSPPEMTLITCTNGNKNRLIIKAREVK